MATKAAVPEQVAPAAAAAETPAKGRAAPTEDQLMGRIRRALRLLPDDEARERVIAYLASRYKTRPKQPALFDGLTS